MKCQFTKQSGELCDANAMAGSQFCFSHDPKTAEDKKSAVLKGGLAPKPRKEAEPLEPIDVKSANDILLLLRDTINRVRTQPLTHQKANSVGYLSNVMLKVLEVWKAEMKPEVRDSWQRARAIADILETLDPETREGIIKKWKEQHGIKDDDWRWHPAL